MTESVDSPRICFIDIETAPALIAAWPPLHETNAVWVERNTYLLCFSVLWAGEKKVKTYALPDYPDYEKDPHCDSRLAEALWTILDAADIVIGHNGDSFDLKTIRSRLLVHGHDPPSPFKTVDTLKLARRCFKFDSNKLDNLGRYLKCGRKIPNTGANLWRECVGGNVKAWRRMKAYNAQDVYLLERVYERLKPWANHPDLRVYNSAHGCPTCLSPKTQRRGISIARSRKYQRFHCQSCGAWFSGELVK